MKEENSIHILIIEDNPDDRASLRRMLLTSSDRSYVFSEAQLGAGGVRAYREAAGTPPDCVLLDYHLPDMKAQGGTRGASQRIRIPCLPRSGLDRIGRSQRQ